VTRGDHVVEGARDLGQILGRSNAKCPHPAPTTLTLRNSSRLTDTLGIEPSVKPITTSRPSGASARTLSSKREPPTGSKITFAGPASLRQSPSLRTTSSAPASRATRSFSSVETTATTRAPRPLPTWIAAVPVPPAAPCTSSVSPVRSAARRASAKWAVW